MAAARAGDRSALDALLRRHHERLWRLCRRILGNDDDAGDALQEALVAIARGIRRFDGRAAFATWSHRVATNACLDELRRRQRRPLLMADRVGDGRGDGTGRGRAAPGSGSPAGTTAVEAIEGWLDVDAALAQLPHDLRVAVVLRDVCDLDYATIGEVLAIPPGTVRSRIARGRGHLARLLGNHAIPSERPTNAP